MGISLVPGKDMIATDVLEKLEEIDAFVNSVTFNVPTIEKRPTGPGGR